MYLAQLIISIPLLFVLFFGIGFILNMLLKTTWLPLIIYLGTVIAVIYFQQINNLFTVVNAVLFFSGLAGAIGSVWTIRILRAKGYTMF